VSASTLKKAKVATPKKTDPAVRKALVGAYKAEPSLSPESVGLEKALKLVGDKYSLQIIQLLLTHETQRFVELESAIHGISPRTLSARLKHLEGHGLLTRKAFATIPPKVEYRATEKGKALAGVIDHLCQWVLPN
jgi:DNA-binding HxlR family transcriptional regulator